MSITHEGAGAPARPAPAVIIEIAPMRNLSQFVGTDREIVTIRPTQAGETPDLWSILARFENGRCRHIADRRQRVKAAAFARRFRRKLRAIAPACSCALVSK